METNTVPGAQVIAHIEYGGYGSSAARLSDGRQIDFDELVAEFFNYEEFAARRGYPEDADAMSGALFDRIIHYAMRLAGVTHVDDEEGRQGDEVELVPFEENAAAIEEALPLTDPELLTLLESAKPRIQELVAGLTKTAMNDEELATSMKEMYPEG